MFKSGVNLKDHSNYKIGGRARQFCNPKNVEEIIECLDNWRRLAPHRAGKASSGAGVFILGGGTNLLINDKGFNGLVLKPEIDLLNATGDMVKVGAGVSMSDLLQFTISKSLSGLEWAGGLPGTVGGAIRGNAGAFGGETKDSIKEVVSLDISGKTPKIVKRNNSECKFGYRNSIYKMNDGREIILEATFVLKKGNRKAIEEAIESKIKYRKERHPMDYPNIGSIFKNVPLTQIVADLNADIARIDENTIRVNPRGNQRESAFTAPVKKDPFPVVPTAYLISECGLKGVSWGGAMISPKHPNFIVNVLDAKAEDVKVLIKLVKAAVKEKYDIKLEEEIIYI